MFPETCRSVTEDDRHILTSFRSQLLLVHARITYPDPLPEPIYIDGRLDYELTYREYEGEEIFDVRQRTHRLNLHFHKLLKDNVWEESASYSLKSPDPLSIVDPMYALDHHYSEEHYYHRSDENRARNPMYWDVSAASSDDHLLVALFRRDKYDDTEYHSQMEYGYGPFTNVKIAIFDPPRYNSYYEPCITKGVEFYCDFEDCKITKPFIFVHDDDVFVKVWSKAEALHKFRNLKRASLKSLLNDNGSKWNDSLSIPDSAYSNLTLLGNQIIIVMSHSNNYDPSLYLCALTSCNSNDTWVELTQFDYQFDPAPVAIGSPDGSKLVAIGMMKPQLGSSQDLHVLQVVPQGKEINRLHTTST